MQALTCVREKPSCGQVVAVVVVVVVVPLLPHLACSSSFFRSRRRIVIVFGQWWRYYVNTWVANVAAATLLVIQSISQLVNQSVECRLKFTSLSSSSSPSHPTTQLMSICIQCFIATTVGSNSLIYEVDEGEYVIDRSR